LPGKASVDKNIFKRKLNVFNSSVLFRTWNITPNLATSRIGGDNSSVQQGKENIDKSMSRLEQEMKPFLVQYHSNYLL